MGLYAKQLTYIADTGSNQAYSEQMVRANILGAVQDFLDAKEVGNLELNGAFDPDLCFFAEVLISSNGSVYKVFSRRMVLDSTEFSYINCNMMTIMDKTTMATKSDISGFKLKNYATITYEQNGKVYFDIAEAASGDLVHGAALVNTVDGFEEVQISKTDTTTYKLVESDVTKFINQSVIVTYLIKE